MRRTPIKPIFRDCLNSNTTPILNREMVVQNKFKRWCVGDSYGLCNIYLYEKGNDEPVEVHYLEDYLVEGETCLAEIEDCFEKELALYDYIEVDCSGKHKREVYEYNKPDQQWYLTEQTDENISIN